MTDLMTTVPHLEIIQRAESAPLWSTWANKEGWKHLLRTYIVLLFESNVMLEALLLLLLLLKYSYWCGISVRIALCIFGLSAIFNPALR